LLCGRDSFAQINQAVADCEADRTGKAVLQFDANRAGDE